MTQLILTNTALDHDLLVLRSLLTEGQLHPEKHNEYSRIILNLHRYDDKELVRNTISGLRNEFPAIGSDKTMQGLAFVKKHGYAGDFEIIDKIYTRWHSDNPEFRTWDQYFHNQTAPQAVRNRKEFFKETLRELAQEIPSGEIKVLNLASGPCRDILEFLEETQEDRFRFTCVELDPNAIAYAKNLLGHYADKVEFINQNIFRYKPDNQYDLVWSAGLFDYFDDNTFTKILARFNEQPYIIIGNFSDANPTSGYMEVIGEWYLNCRSAGLLRRLSKDAGFQKENIRIKHEPTEVNLFLHIRK